MKDKKIEESLFCELLITLKNSLLNEKNNRTIKKIPHKALKNSLKKAFRKIEKLFIHVENNLL
jgi:hypothetical protein